MLFLWQAQEKGCSSFILGLIIGTNCLTTFLVTPTIGKKVSKNFTFEYKCSYRREKKMGVWKCSIKWYWLRFECVTRLECGAVLMLHDWVWCFGKGMPTEKVLQETIKTGSTVQYSIWRFGGERWKSYSLVYLFYAIWQYHLYNIFYLITASIHILGCDENRGKPEC